MGTTYCEHGIADEYRCGSCDERIAALQAEVEALRVMLRHAHYRIGHDINSACDACKKIEAALSGGGK